jgi:glutamyl-Q tRNA(Asp) synthetase
LLSKEYRGRFAPSPSGPLHLGSLYTALASFLQARQKKGRWFLRIDDLDTPRVVKGATDNILKTLDAFSLEWDGAVLYQSQQLECYEKALEPLHNRSLVYPCNCSRKELLKANKGCSTIHPALCPTSEALSSNKPHALRIKTKETCIKFTDLLQGEIKQDIHKEVGDFILQRRDQIYAYHLATVVDDESLGITEVLRGIDLLDSTPRQLYLLQQLNFNAPVFAHTPILTNAEGIKLSKKCLAEPVGTEDPTKALLTCLELLGQNPPSKLSKATKAELLEWATENWDPLKLSRTERIDCSIKCGIPQID